MWKELSTLYVCVSICLNAEMPPCRRAWAVDSEGLGTGSGSSGYATDGSYQGGRVTLLTRPACGGPTGIMISKDMLLVKGLSRVQLFATPWTIATRLLCPRDSPGKNTGVGCRALLQGPSLLKDWTWVFCTAAEPAGKPIKVSIGVHACEVAQLCLTLCDPVDCTHQTPLAVRFPR